MAVTDPYATVQEYRDAIGKSDDGDDTTITFQIDAVSRFLEREAGQFFGKDATAVARVFEARWSDLLDLRTDLCPGIATTADLEIKQDTDLDGSFADESAWASTDYELLPLAAAQGPEPGPYTRISVPSWSTKSFSPGARVQVTAVFGWPAVPDAVKSLTLELLGIWRGENPRATGHMNELEQVVASSPMAMSLVKRFRNAYRRAVTF